MNAIDKFERFETTVPGRLNDALRYAVSRVEEDQLIVEAKLSNNDFTDGEGIERYGYNFTVENFDFGAPGELKRAQLARRQE